MRKNSYRITNLISIHLIDRCASDGKRKRFLHKRHTECAVPRRHRHVYSLWVNCKFTSLCLCPFRAVFRRRLSIPLYPPSRQLCIFSPGRRAPSCPATACSSLRCRCCATCRRQRASPGRTASPWPPAIRVCKTIWVNEEIRERERERRKSAIRG